MQLYPHNQSAYEAALALLSETGKAAVVHPTGTGKSFIALQLCADHPASKVCWLSPSEVIFRLQLENWRQSGGAEPENISFFTYARLMNRTEDDLRSLRPDYIILDEFHRCGAEQWGAGVERLLALYPSVPVLGLSATAVRYLDNQRNMADELFGGNLASEMTLGEAIVRGILKAPKYVLSVFPYQSMLASYESRVRSLRSKPAQHQAEQALEALRRALAQADGLDVIFARHMAEPHGKYLLFCANAEHMAEMMAKAPEWFRLVDPAPHVYSVLAEDPESVRTFRAFQADESDHLKLLYCVDMLNEGIHVSGVNGVVLLRPTVSPIVYKQQIGRALSAGKQTEPVIFDIVLNIENLTSIDAVQEEMQTVVDFCRQNGEADAIVNERFRVVDEVRSCMELFARLNESLSASWESMYRSAQQYFLENGDLEVPRRYVTPEGYALGSWLSTQRKVRAGHQCGTLTPAQIQKLDALNMRWESARDLSWEKGYAAAQEYFRLHGDLLAPVQGEPVNGVALGRWLAQVRVSRKYGTGRFGLTEERIRALDEIGMVWALQDRQWEVNCAAAADYRAQFGNLDVPYQYVSPSGVRLGAWLYQQRMSRASLPPERRKRLTELGLNWSSKHDDKWLRFYEAACAYAAANGSLAMPSDYVTPDGLPLGKWISRQREAYKKNLPPERKEKLSAIGMVWEKDPWMEKFALLRRYYAEHGNVSLPADYVIDGVWLRRWLTEQTARLNEKPTGRSRTVKRLTEAQKACLAEVGVLPKARPQL